MILAAALVFLISTLGMVYPYVIYPALLRWMAKHDHLPDLKAGFQPLHEFPRVALIVAAYNEAQVIREKLFNFEKLDYPKDRLRFILASDGSTDQTVKIAREFSEKNAQIEVRDFATRRGKVCVLNEVIASLQAEEFIVFSDANVEFAPEAIQELLTPFQHPNIGTVCGKLTLMDVQTGSSQAESRYWRLENELKENEGKVGSALGANGAIFAIRRALWTPCPEHLLVEDFYVPMKLLCDGWWNYFQKSAQAFEYTPPTLNDEFKRRVRIGAGAYQIWFALLPHLGRLDGFSLFAYLSHKGMRWFTPMLLLVQGLSLVYISVSLFGALSTLIWAAAVTLLLWKGTGWRGMPQIARSILLMIQQFLGMNAALLVGWTRFLRNSQKVTWQRTAR